jgi:replicative DNA helicase
VVWEGPLLADLLKDSRALLDLARTADAGTVIVDSLKDLATKLSDDEVGSTVNRAMQFVVADGREILGLHHPRKGQGGSKPITLEDLYGSTWLAAGAGSVLSLWGAAGDPIVELRHLKQPAAEVGPLRIENHSATGHMTVFGGEVDPLSVVRNGGAEGVTTLDLTRLMFPGSKEISDNQRKKAQRKLDRLVTGGHVHKVEHQRGGDTGTTPARYFPIDTDHSDEP